MTEDYTVKGKVALITGAGSGINHALAEKLLSEGCSVMIADTGLCEESQATLDKYAKKGESEAFASFCKTNVVDWSQLNALWKTTLDVFGHIDIVVNGAGIFEPPQSSFWNPPGISPLSKDAADATIGSYHIFNVNAIGPIRLAQIAIDYWSENKIQGNLLWVSSIGGYIHSIQTPFYFASKATLLSMVTSLQGLRKIKGIRNSAICPGPTRTPLFHQDFCKDRLGEEDLALTQNEVANLMLELLTDKKYGDGNILEVMKVGTKEEPIVHQREVQLNLLYPTVSPMGAGTKAMDEEIQFMRQVAEKGMRSSC